MSFKFEKLEIWHQALDYTDLVYAVIEKLPHSEEFNLRSQLRRAATSVHLNIAEGSTGQTDAEQARFLGIALRSLIETVACLHQIARREMTDDIRFLRTTYKAAEGLAIRIQAMRKTISPKQKSVREESEIYVTNISDDFVVIESTNEQLSDEAWLSSVVRRPSSTLQRS